MAMLLTTVVDPEGAPRIDVEVTAYLSDDRTTPITEFDDDGILIGKKRAVTDAAGLAVLNLVPNADVHRPGTRYTVNIYNPRDSIVPPKVILKTDLTQTLEQAMVFTPTPLGSPFGFGNLFDVDLTGLSVGYSLRWDGTKWVPFLPSGSGLVPFRRVSTSQSLTSFDQNIRADAAGAPITLTLPSAFAIGGTPYSIKRVNSGGNSVTIATVSGQTIDDLSNWVLGQYNESVNLLSDDANWMVM